MNREEIQKLEAGRVLDSLIADKLMGFKAIKFLKLYPTRCSGIPSTSDREEKRILIPLYSLILEDAWKLFKKLREIDSHWCPSIYWDDDDGDSDGYWSVVLHYYGETVEEYKSYSAYADTEALAICRAIMMYLDDVK